MSLENLVFISYTMRWFVLVASVIGFLVALLSLIEAHRTVRANVKDGDRRILARSRRSSEALSVAAQLTFMAVGLSFVAFPPAPPSSPSQVGPYFDGILRTGGFGFGAMVLALKSLLNLVTESDLGIQRLMTEAARVVADLETINRRLEEATQAKSEFLANMSHELRTPLNAILGFSDLLDEQLGGQIAERQRRYLRNIHDAGDHLLALVNDILDLSKVEAGRVELRPELASLVALLEPVVAAIGPAAVARGVVFEVDASDPTPLWVDPGRVRQILLNLLSNATKFTPAGGTVRLDARLDGRDLLLVVSDTGIGIPAERHDRVFGVFERPNEDRSDATGTGLGLALTKRLVELHGGSISFTSVIDEGTAFAVRLPDVSGAVIAGDRVLIVEDERRDADLIVALASGHGLRSEVVRTVAAATASIRAARPIAVLLDLRLPDGRGEAVLSVARQATPPIPVVIISIEDDDGRARGLGADDYLTKPIDYGRLSGWMSGVAARRAAVDRAGAA
jgi:signal transduction histidine kinase/CheY-like chemotaxis protein